MSPVAKIYWIVTLLLLPLSLWWLHATLGGDYSAASLADANLALLAAGLLTVWTVLGTYDHLISDSNLRRNYPVLANLRYLLESFRPEIQQYFISNNIEEKPFSRERRNLVYSRAKGELDTLPFGTEQDLLEDGYRTVMHSIDTEHVEADQGRLLFGGEQCKLPYEASRLNISAMSFGSLSSRAIEALNRGARLGNFAHNTGEGGISPYHLKYGGDLIWQIGTGYFGCRKTDGRFDVGAYAEQASRDEVKMIELKISQGAKPSHGGVLPGSKVTEEIARIRMVEVGKTVVSPAEHPEFDTPLGLLQFLQLLRENCGGKPVGFKLCIGRHSEFMAIVKAMLESGILPDFITVDGAEGGTGAAPIEFMNRFGLLCLEGTFFVDQVLVGAGLRDRIRVISSGLTASGFDMLEKVALGADTVNAARSMMFALGCVQARSCNTNNCPTGITTQDPRRVRAVVVDDKSERVRLYHEATVRSFLELCGAMGYSSPEQLQPGDLYQRVDAELRNYSILRPAVSSGEFLDQPPPTYADDWAAASPERF